VPYVKRLKTETKRGRQRSRIRYDRSMSTETGRAAPCAVGPTFQDPRLYVEEAVLPEREVLALAHECGLEVPPNLLAWYIENGYFAPVIEIAVLDGPDTPPILGYSRWQLLPLFELERARHNSLKIWPDRPAGGQDRQSWQWQLQTVKPGLRTLSEDFRPLARARAPAAEQVRRRRPRTSELRC